MLSPGTRIGPYEIVGPLGAGGMGEVYRANDVRLGRDVAIKALPAEVAQDADRRTRFEREALLLASLNHPNIATIHGLEEAGGAKYLVLELVDGRTLSEVMQVAGGPLPVNEAIAISLQIAEALVAAHEKGIIHRDLKPGNVMVGADGQVKVLDFGLGKSLDSDPSRSTDPSAAAHSPTLTMAATQAGLILGTAGYMSPEQAKGRPADRRSDVWGFGCLLFEMLSGKRAFDGEDVTEILAHIVRGEPDWEALPASVSPALRALAQRCLVKDRSQRISDMSVVRFLLQERASAAPVSAAHPPAETARRGLSWPLAVGLVAAAVLVTTVATRLLAPAAPGHATRASHLSIVLPDDTEVASTNMRPFDVSPDGASLVYVGRRGDDAPQLYLRALAGAEPLALPGTDGARSPFYSPDGRWIAFFAQGQLKKITIGGTGLQTIADAADARGGCWAKDDTLYFAPTNVSGIMKVAASGGAATPVSKPDRGQGEVSHRWPYVLPDGKTLLFTIWTGPGTDERQIVRQSLSSGERTVLVRGGDGAQYVAPGFLLYGRLDGLFAIPWRPEQTDLSGVVPITLPEFPRLENEGGSDFVVSAEGTLACVSGGPARIARRIVWVDRAGNVDALPLPERDYEAVAISPDGKQVAVQLQESAIGLWLYDIARQTLSPFATTGGSSQSPVWTPDGSRIIYRGTRNGHRNLFWKSADGTGPEERLTTKEEVVQTPTSVSPDGHWVVFTEGGGQALGNNMTWTLRLDGDRTPRPILDKGCLNGHISPDGRWLAYQSFASGRGEIYVQAFPGPGPRRQVSVGGGEAPLWSRDGRELFYTTTDKLMAVSVAGGSDFSPGPPRVLHEGRFRTSLNANTPYDVAADGRRFLRVRSVQPERAVTRIDVALNWFDELRRVAAGK